MRSLSYPTVDEIVEAGEHLPNGATLVIGPVSWDDYELLLEALEDRAGLRVAYDCGSLEIMSPANRHGRFETLIDQLVIVFCELFEIKCEGYGRATWKRESLAKGIEPDGAYYIRNLDRIIGKEELDLESDAPPDIAVEVDVTRNSLRKFPIYAALGVSEVWRYNGEICRLHGLSEGRFIEIESSKFLPGLTGPMIAEACELSKTAGQDEARKSFRRKLQALL
jgi:Uma2 family endonuclease